ncbi:MAG: PilZ domain-containing protein [Burkholderiales bacterium]|nr:PilZ domain-containing protein [Burkholderiales bacterium]
MTDMTELDLRLYPRAVFRCRARLSVEDKPPINAWTVDISMDGISIMLAEPIELGQYCVVKFETAISGSPRQFSAIAKSVYCVCSCTGQYRIGFQFYGINPAQAAIINELLC